jgi:CheY-like chemotaxis protein/nitrogen-specific signal transduction histidine kinase
MQVNSFQPEDLFAQIQTLVDGLEAERRARLAAEAADATKSALLSVIDRELRTPMESVVAMAELLRASKLDASQQCYTETLVRSARSILNVVDDVVDLSKLETGEAELACEPFDLHGLVRGVASALQAQAAKKGLTTGVDMGANCPRFVVGDETRVRQALMTLIATALQSTSEGTVRFYVSIIDAESPLTVRFDVTDTGAGFTDDEQTNLFCPSADTSCAGLSLPIARRLAEAMGGEVGCNSALGQGTLYWFTFRAVLPEDEDETHEQGGDGARKNTLSGHVLVAEDNMVNRLLIGEYLDEFGLTHEMVENGAAALMCLAARRYDLVLMDMVLPDYDGMKIAKRVRTMQAPSSDVPIVALAASNTERDYQDHVAVGINARVSKPIQGPALYAALVPFVSARKDGEAFAEAS